MKWRMLLMGSLMVLAGACTRVAPLYTLKSPNSYPDTVHDVLHLLDSMPNASLFAQAVERAGISGQLDPADFFTLFVPTDSAMTAAGLTSGVIAGLSSDSLSKIVLYHITYGAVSDTALNTALLSVQQNCLLETLFYNQSANNYGGGGATSGYSSYRHSLFVKYYNGLLNINGWAVNAGEQPMRAANGYLYPIRIVLQPPGDLVWNVITARPELSYYVAAIRFMDSILLQLNPNGYSTTDSVLFSQIRYEPVAGSQFNSTVSPTRPTVFAPTNTAFINAGIPDIDSLENLILGEIQTDTLWYGDSVSCPSCYVLNNIPGQGFQLLPNGGESGVFNYFPFDSVLKMHYWYNAGLQAQASSGLSFTNALCYSDLTGSVVVNNGAVNASSLYPRRLLQFSAGAGGILTIRWNVAGVNNAVIPEDSSQLERRRNFWLLNGVIYESDRLFFGN